MYFPTSGVEVFPLWPVMSAFGISFFCSMAGISGAFLLLPYQISILGYILPGVSATNQIFNILACPAGVWRYMREGRLLLPLAIGIAVGTLPGVFLGALIRVKLLANNEKFLFFVALVLLYLGTKMLLSPKSGKKGPPGNTRCEVLSSNWQAFTFSFAGQTHRVKTLPLSCLSFAVGIVGGTYGIGGGAIMVPFLVAFFGLPVYAIAGASLFATFLTSVVGVIFYSLLAHFLAFPWAAPDWALGLLLGIGGMAGMYCGASMQRFVPPGILRLLITAIIFVMGFGYLFRVI